MKELQTFTTEETAELLGVRDTTLERWRRSGRSDLPYVRVGHLIRYRWADIEEYLERHRVRGRGRHA